MIMYIFKVEQPSPVTSTASMFSQTTKISKAETIYNFHNQFHAIYSFEVNIESTRKICEISSKSVVKTPERPQQRLSHVFIVTSEQNSYIVMMCPFVTLNKQMPSEIFYSDTKNSSQIYFHCISVQKICKHETMSIFVRRNRIIVLFNICNCSNIKTKFYLVLFLTPMLCG